MEELLRRIQMWITAVGTVGVLTLAVLTLIVERGKNTSTVVLLIILGFALLTLVVAFSSIRHAQHIGRLRWLGVVWTLLPVFLILPAALPLWIYNVSSAAVVFMYVTVVAAAAGVIGLLREVLNRTVGFAH